jgi:hypothetical protein
MTNEPAEFRDIPSPEEFIPLKEMLTILPNSFPSEHSLKWFIRRNRAALADLGAVALITDRIRLHKERFPKAVTLIGQALVAVSPDSDE